MGTLTTAGKNQLLQKIDGNTTAVTWYLAPFNGDPAGAGTEVSATTTEGRQQLTTSNLGSAASGVLSNDVAVTWTATGSITVDYVAAYDAAAAGNLVFSDAITSIARTTGQTVVVAIGDLDISLTDS